MQTQKVISGLGRLVVGLNKYDVDTDRFFHYLAKDGLANNVVYGILEDGSGNLWISTNQGISKFDPQKEIFKNYDSNDGLQSNEFNAGAFFRSSSGEMFFGGINGFNRFFPKKIQDDRQIPAIVFY